MFREESYVEYKYGVSEKILLPYILLKGEGSGPTVCITAGIHGCEFPAVASAIALSKRLESKRLKGTIKIIPLVDMKAFKGKNMFVCPVDKKNLNRCFPGDLKGSYSEVLIHHLFNDFIKKSDYYIDLHSADLTEAMIPFCEVHKSKDDEINEISLNMARYSAIPDIVIKSGEGIVNDKNQSYSTAADAGIPSLVMNAGQTDENIEDYIGTHLRGLINILTYLKCIEGSLIEHNNYRYYKAPVHIRAKKEGLFYSNCKVGEEVNKGEIIGRIEDIFGNKLEELISPARGKVLLVNAAIPVKENSLVLEIIVRK